jgi:hypothetical protein
MSQGFRMSAPEAKNGFMGRRIVSSGRPRRNTQGKNVNIFKAREIAGRGGNEMKYRRLRWRAGSLTATG